MNFRRKVHISKQDGRYFRSPVCKEKRWIDLGWCPGYYVGPPIWRQSCFSGSEVTSGGHLGGQLGGTTWYDLFKILSWEVASGFDLGWSPQDFVLGEPPLENTSGLSPRDIVSGCLLGLLSRANCSGESSWAAFLGKLLWAANLADAQTVKMSQLQFKIYFEVLYLIFPMIL